MKGTMRRTAGLVLGRLATFSLAMTLVLATSGTTAPQTASVWTRVALAAPCYDSGCQGLSPTGTGCVNDGRVIDAAGSTAQAGDYFYAQLAYSDTCAANWGATYTPQIQTCNGTPGWCSGVHLGQSCCGGYYNQADEGPNYYADLYRTTMLSGISSYDRACTWDWVCTIWH